MDRVDEAVMVGTILSAYRELSPRELELASDRLAELVWYELREAGAEVDVHVYLHCYRRALKILYEEELDRNPDDIEVALRNAASRGCTPYEWMLVGRRRG